MNIHKPKVGEEDDDETLVTIKGDTAAIGIISFADLRFCLCRLVKQLWRAWVSLLSATDVSRFLCHTFNVVNGTDKACETINTVFVQFAAAMKAKKAGGK